MEVYRIARTQYIDDLSGTGARMFGGRWNHKGAAMLYTSGSRALATLEFLVHVPRSIAPGDLSIATLRIPNDIIPTVIQVSGLPHNWREYPAPSKIAEIGANWLKSDTSLLLRVPSVVVEQEHNILINPSHPDMKHVIISQIDQDPIDQRLLRP